MITEEVFFFLSDLIEMPRKKDEIWRKFKEVIISKGWNLTVLYAFNWRVCSFFAFLWKKNNKKTKKNMHFSKFCTLKFRRTSYIYFGQFVWIKKLSYLLYGSVASLPSPSSNIEAWPYGTSLHFASLLHLGH